MKALNSFHDADGKHLLESVLGFKDAYFSSLPDDDTNKMVGEELELVFQKVKSYASNLGFVSGPSTPNRPIKPKKKLILALSFIMSVFFFIFMAFVLEWWSNNKEEFTS